MVRVKLEATKEGIISDLGHKAESGVRGSWTELISSHWTNTQDHAHHPGLELNRSGNVIEQTQTGSRIGVRRKIIAWVESNSATYIAMQYLF